MATGGYYTAIEEQKKAQEAARRRQEEERKRQEEAARREEQAARQREAAQREASQRAAAEREAKARADREAAQRRAEEAAKREAQLKQQREAQQRAAEAAERERREKERRAQEERMAQLKATVDAKKRMDQQRSVKSIQDFVGGLQAGKPQPKTWLQELNARKAELSETAGNYSNNTKTASTAGNYNPTTKTEKGRTSAYGEDTAYELGMNGAYAAQIARVKAGIEDSKGKRLVVNNQDRAKYEEKMLQLIRDFGIDKINQIDIDDETMEKIREAEYKARVFAFGDRAETPDAIAASKMFIGTDNFHEIEAAETMKRVGDVIARKKYEGQIKDNNSGFSYTNDTFNVDRADTKWANILKDEKKAYIPEYNGNVDYYKDLEEKSGLDHNQLIRRCVAHNCTPEEYLANRTVLDAHPDWHLNWLGRYTFSAVNADEGGKYLNEHALDCVQIMIMPGDAAQHTLSNGALAIGKDMVGTDYEGVAYYNIVTGDIIRLKNQNDYSDLYKNTKHKSEILLAMRDAYTARGEQLMQEANKLVGYTEHEDAYIRYLMRNGRSASEIEKMMDVPKQIDEFVEEKYNQLVSQAEASFALAADREAENAMISNYLDAQSKKYVSEDFYNREQDYYTESLEITAQLDAQMREAEDAKTGITQPNSLLDVIKGMMAISWGSTTNVNWDNFTTVGSTAREIRRIWEDALGDYKELAEGYYQNSGLSGIQKIFENTKRDKKLVQEQKSKALMEGDIQKAAAIEYQSKWWTYATAFVITPALNGLAEDADVFLNATFKPLVLGETAYNNWGMLQDNAYAKYLQDKTAGVTPSQWDLVKYTWQYLNWASEKGYGGYVESYFDAASDNNNISDGFKTIIDMTMDIILDPTTWLSAGASAGAEVVADTVSKGSREAILKVSKELGQELSDDAIEEVLKATRKTLKQVIKEEGLDEGIEKVSKLLREELDRRAAGTIQREIKDAAAHSAKLDIGKAQAKLAKDKQFNQKFVDIVHDNVQNAFKDLRKADPKAYNAYKVASTTINLNNAIDKMQMVTLKLHASGVVYPIKSLKSIVKYARELGVENRIAGTVLNGMFCKVLNAFKAVTPEDLKHTLDAIDEEVKILTEAGTPCAEKIVTDLTYDTYNAITVALREEFQNIVRIDPVGSFPASNTADWVDTVMKCYDTTALVQFADRLEVAINECPLEYFKRDLNKLRNEVLAQCAQRDEHVYRMVSREVEKAKNAVERLLVNIDGEYRVLEDGTIDRFIYGYVSENAKLNTEAVGASLENITKATDKLTAEGIYNLYSGYAQRVQEKVDLQYVDMDTFDFNTLKKKKIFTYHQLGQGQGDGGELNTRVVDTLTQERFLEEWQHVDMAGMRNSIRARISGEQIQIYAKHNGLSYEKDRGKILDILTKEEFEKELAAKREKLLKKAHNSVTFDDVSAYKKAHGLDDAENFKAKKLAEKKKTIAASRLEEQGVHKPKTSDYVNEKVIKEFEGGKGDGVHYELPDEYYASLREYNSKLAEVTDTITDADVEQYEKDITQALADATRGPALAGGRELNDRERKWLKKNEEMIKDFMELNKTLEELQTMLTEGAYTSDIAEKYHYARQLNSRMSQTVNRKIRPLRNLDLRNIDPRAYATADDVLTEIQRIDPRAHRNLTRFLDYLDNTNLTDIANIPIVRDFRSLTPSAYADNAGLFKYLRDNNFDSFDSFTKAANNIPINDRPKAVVRFMETTSALPQSQRGQVFEFVNNVPYLGLSYSKYAEVASGVTNASTRSGNIVTRAIRSFEVSPDGLGKIKRAVNHMCDSMPNEEVAKVQTRMRSNLAKVQDIQDRIDKEVQYFGQHYKTKSHSEFNKAFGQYKKCLLDPDTTASERSYLWDRVINEFQIYRMQSREDRAAAVAECLNRNGVKEGTVFGELRIGNVTHDVVYSGSGDQFIVVHGITDVQKTPIEYITYDELYKQNSAYLGALSNPDSTLRKQHFKELYKALSDAVWSNPEHTGAEVAFLKKFKKAGEDYIKVLDPEHKATFLKLLGATNYTGSVADADVVYRSIVNKLDETSDLYKLGLPQNIYGGVFTKTYIRPDGLWKSVNNTTFEKSGVDYEAELEKLRAFVEEARKSQKFALRDLLNDSKELEYIKRASHDPGYSTALERAQENMLYDDFIDVFKSTSAVLRNIEQQVYEPMRPLSETLQNAGDTFYNLAIVHDIMQAKTHNYQLTNDLEKMSYIFDDMKKAWSLELGDRFHGRYMFGVHQDIPASGFYTGGVALPGSGQMLQKMRNTYVGTMNNMVEQLNDLALNASTKSINRAVLPNKVLYNNDLFKPFAGMKTTKVDDVVDACMKHFDIKDTEGARAQIANVFVDNPEKIKYSDATKVYEFEGSNFFANNVLTKLDDVNEVIKVLDGQPSTFALDVDDAVFKTSKTYDKCVELAVHKRTIETIETACSPEVQRHVQGGMINYRNTINQLLNESRGGAAEYSKRKITDILVEDAQKQLNFGNPNSITFMHPSAPAGYCNSVDVLENVRKMEQMYTSQKMYKEYLDDGVLPIFFSLNCGKTTSSAPTAYAFNVPGLGCVYNYNKCTEFAQGAHYKLHGMDQDTFTSEIQRVYEKYGAKEMNDIEFGREMYDFVDQAVQYAKSQGLRVKFVGFNNSSAFTDQNSILRKFFTENSVPYGFSGFLDMADVKRLNAGCKLLSDADVEGIKRAASTMVDEFGKYDGASGILPKHGIEIYNLNEKTGLYTALANIDHQVGAVLGYRTGGAIENGGMGHLMFDADELTKVLQSLAGRGGNKKKLNVRQVLEIIDSEGEIGLKHVYERELHESWGINLEKLNRKIVKEDGTEVLRDYAFNNPRAVQNIVEMLDNKYQKLKMADELANTSIPQEELQAVRDWFRVNGVTGVHSGRHDLWMTYSEVLDHAVKTDDYGRFLTICSTMRGALGSQPPMDTEFWHKVSTLLDNNVQIPTKERSLLLDQIDCNTGMSELRRAFYENTQQHTIKLTDMRRNDQVMFGVYSAQDQRVQNIYNDARDQLDKMYNQFFYGVPELKGADLNDPFKVADAQRALGKAKQALAKDTTQRRYALLEAFNSFDTADEQAQFILRNCNNCLIVQGRELAIKDNDLVKHITLENGNHLYCVNWRANTAKCSAWLQDDAVKLSDKVKSKSYMFGAMRDLANTALDNTFAWSNGHRITQDDVFRIWDAAGLPEEYRLDPAVMRSNMHEMYNCMVIGSDNFTKLYDPYAGRTLLEGAASGILTIDEHCTKANDLLLCATSKRNSLAYALQHYQIGNKRGLYNANINDLKRTVKELESENMKLYVFDQHGIPIECTRLQWAKDNADKVFLLDESAAVQIRQFAKGQIRTNRIDNSAFWQGFYYLQDAWTNTTRNLRYLGYMFNNALPAAGLRNAYDANTKALAQAGTADIIPYLMAGPKLDNAYQEICAKIVECGTLDDIGIKAFFDEGYATMYGLTEQQFRVLHALQGDGLVGVADTLTETLKHQTARISKECEGKYTDDFIDKCIAKFQKADNKAFWKSAAHSQDKLRYVESLSAAEREVYAHYITQGYKGKVNEFVRKMPWVKLNENMFNGVEGAVRKAMAMYYTDLGDSVASIAKKITESQFNYGSFDKMVSMAMPFSAFKFYNVKYWADLVESNPRFVNFAVKRARAGGYIYGEEEYAELFQWQQLREHYLDTMDEWRADQSNEELKGWLDEYEQQVVQYQGNGYLDNHGMAVGNDHYVKDGDSFATMFDWVGDIFNVFDSIGTGSVCDALGDVLYEPFVKIVGMFVNKEHIFQRDGVLTYDEAAEFASYIPFIDTLWTNMRRGLRTGHLNTKTLMFFGDDTRTIAREVRGSWAEYLMGELTSLVGTRKIPVGSAVPSEYRALSKYTLTDDPSSYVDWYGLCTKNGMTGKEALSFLAQVWYGNDTVLKYDKSQMHDTIKYLLERGYKSEEILKMMSDRKAVQWTTEADPSGLTAAEIRNELRYTLQKENYAALPDYLKYGDYADVLAWYKERGFTTAEANALMRKEHPYIDPEGNIRFMTDQAAAQYINREDEAYAKYWDLMPDCAKYSFGCNIYKAVSEYRKLYHWDAEKALSFMYENNIFWDTKNNRLQKFTDEQIAQLNAQNNAEFHNGGTACLTSSSTTKACTRQQQSGCHV